MPPDCYQVEVLYFLNPHLIWIEVIDSSIVKGGSCVFEQVGLYGVIPVEPMLDVVEENLKTQISEEWLPAASATIKEALVDAQEIWFSPTYIDRSSSIFDDNIHKYGELLLKRHNDKLKPLSSTLIKAGFAIYDTCLFHQEFSSDKLKTKLKSSESQVVIKEIENYYKKKKVPKKDWEKSVKTQTVVAHATQELESALTEINLKKHNDKVMLKILQNKINDFEMCKGVDEEAVGRAYKAEKKKACGEIKTKETITSKHKESSLKSSFLKKKLELMATKKIYIQDLEDQSKNDTKQILEPTNKFLGVNISNILENNGYKEPVIYGHTLPIERNKVPLKAMSNHSVKQQPPDNRDNHNEGTTPKQNIFKCNEKRVCYGPPGVHPRKLTLKVMTHSTHEQPNAFREEIDVEITEKEDIYANVDSCLNVEIINKNILLSIQQDKEIKPKYTGISRNSTDNSQNEPKKVSNELYSYNLLLNDSSPDITDTQKSKVLQKKLMLHERKMTKTLNSSFTSYSDTTEKDSFSSLEEIKIKQREKIQQIAQDSDEDIDEIIKKINIECPMANICNKPEHHQSGPKKYNNTIKNSVNPFKNIDPKMSFFIDKLVTPVLMVHTKMNKRIEPVFDLREINFNTHIHVALKNMSVERPMMLQTISWFCILRGYSMFIISPIGSGKTLGYLPAVCRSLSDSSSDNVESVGPMCIIVCATTKSVTDVEKMAKMFLGVKEKVLACFAGVDESYVTMSLLNGCDLLICTPSFLARLLQLTDFGIDLKRLSVMVFDDCERLGEVYSNEVKYILFRIKETLKSRTNKELRVQYILASRIWCDFMEPIAKKAPYSVVCIGAFQECVLYSKSGMSVNFVQQCNKENAVLDFLTEIDVTKRTVIVCRTDEEVITLKKALGKYKNAVFASESSLTIQDLYNLRVAWDEYEDPLLGPILLCCDDTLIHLNVTNAHYLLIYSLPSLFSTFCKRFSVLNDHYPSIFKANNDTVKIKILIEENNIEQLPKMLHFIKRCTDDVPQYLNNICDSVLEEKDITKASNLVAICDNLLGLGYCPDFWNCQSRHTVLENYDNCKEWIPITGQITFKILHYHSAVFFSARLLSNIANSTPYKYPQTYSTLSLKMGMYYSKESNRKLHGIPKLGDVCAVSLKPNFFGRCQVMKILSKYQRGNPNYVLIKLLDEEKLERTRDIYLYHLPDEFKNIETYVIQVRLANIQPKDKDVTFSDLATDQMKKITDKDEDMYIRGQVVMAIGNCVFVDTLEACQDLASLSKTVVKYDFKSDLLQKHAIPNIRHLPKIKKLCAGKIHIEEVTEVYKLSEPTKKITSASWAYLDNDNMSLVFFGCAVSPFTFFVRLQKFESCLNLLIKDIQKSVAENPEPLNEVKEGDIVLAMFPDDATFERARIDNVIDKSKVKCFFVDQGDRREVLIKNLAPISEDFIKRMPFQAIECRLVGVKPAGDEWTDLSTNWFSDKCLDVSTDSLKLLYVKSFVKEKAEFTGGNKYGIVIIDTNSDHDIIINQSLIDVNLAQENVSEVEYLNEYRVENRAKSKLINEQVFVKGDDENQSFDMCTASACEPNNTSTLDSIFKEPIRSVPLVDSENDVSDDSERWNINMTNDFLTIFKRVSKNPDKPKVNLPAITLNETSSSLHDVTEHKQCPGFSNVLQLQNGARHLDSDDFTSAESSDTVTTPEKRIIKSLSVITEMRKPRLIWRQNKNIVYIKINLIGLQMYDVKIGGRSISFAATLNDADYAFDVELYGAIDVKKSFHCNKGQYVLVKLFKILDKNWLTLTKDGEIRKWIVYDVESIDASSDEETVEEHNKSYLLNAVKNICIQNNSDSEEEDFMDDVNYRHKSAKVTFLE